MTNANKNPSIRSPLHDPLRHFSRDRPTVKLIALWLLQLPKLVTAVAFLVGSFQAIGWWRGSYARVGSGMVTVEDNREHYGELRLQSLGVWRGRVVFLVWTPRGDDTAHLIFCRHADRTQAEDYFSAL